MMGYRPPAHVAVSLVVLALLIGAHPTTADAVAAASSGPATTTPPTQVRLDLDLGQEGSQVALSLKIVFLLTVLTVLPSIVLTMTAFTRVIIVLHFLRQALGTQQMPPNQILIGLALFLTVFIMAPVGREIHRQAYLPYQDGTLSFTQALQAAEPPIRQFLLRQTREKDIALFLNMAQLPRPAGPDEVPTYVLVPAFVTSELRTGFQIGFLLFLPFLIVDMVISSILLSMGMMMLPPIMVSLPFKVLLFVLVDGWYLLLGSLVQSFQG